MKNIISCGTRNHNAEMTPLNRTNDFNRLMNYFWNYFDTAGTGTTGEIAGAKLKCL